MKVLNLSTFGGRTVVLCCRAPHPPSSKKHSALKINEWIFNLDTEYRAANGSSVCVLCAVSISMAGKLSSSWQSQISVTVLRISNVGVWLQTTFCWFIEHFVSLCFDVEIFSAIFKADSHVTQSRWNVTFRGKPPYRPKGGFSWADCFGSLVQFAILSQL